MRFRDGFSLGEFEELKELNELKTPGLSRRFLFLDDPERAGPDSLVLVASGTRLEIRANLACAAILAEDGISGLPDSIPVVRIRDARRTLAMLLRVLSPRAVHDTPFLAGPGNTVHPSAIVEGVLEGDVTVEAGVFVGAGVYVGRGTRLEANCVLRGPCVVGPGTVIQSGAVVGCAGFGFFAGDSGNGGAELMPHPSGVRIGARCFIGANTVIAAGVLHPTEISDDCKLDSHVQIAHNVVLGAGSMLASQSGVAGSTVIGEGFRMGGAASVAGHLRIGRNVSVAAKSGVTKDVPDGMTVAGFPARAIGEWRRDMVRENNGKWEMGNGK